MLSIKAGHDELMPSMQADWAPHAPNRRKLVNQLQQDEAQCAGVCDSIKSSEPLRGKIQLYENQSPSAQHLAQYRERNTETNVIACVAV